ncbi:MAG: DinB family protein [bacterium]|nr:DinB family protein [bacterium]
MSTDLLAMQLGYNNYTFHRNTEGVSHQESLVQPHPGGNCLNWVVGHLASSRDQMRGLVGLAPTLGENESPVYARSAEPLTDASKAADFDQLTAAFAQDQDDILTAVAGLTAEQLAAPAPFSPGNNPRETVATLLAGLVFHEAYHIGQTGVLRRIAGHAGVLT